MAAPHKPTTGTKLWGFDGNETVAAVTYLLSNKTKPPSQNLSTEAGELHLDGRASALLEE